MTDGMEASEGRIKTKVQVYPEHPLSMEIENYIDWKRTDTRVLKETEMNQRQIYRFWL